MMPRRSNYFIKKGFQLNFLYRFILLLVVESLLIGGLFMQISSNTLTTGYMDSIFRIERTPNFFLMPFILIILISVVGMGITGMVIFILLSHRIAGPLYRFEQDLEEIGRGDLTKRINIRSTDQLVELKESLNTFTNLFDQRIGSIKSCIEELDKLLAKKDDPENAARIREYLERLKREISRFNVTAKV